MPFSVVLPPPSSWRRASASAAHALAPTAPNNPNSGSYTADEIVARRPSLLRRGLRRSRHPGGEGGLPLRPSERLYHRPGGSGAIIGGLRYGDGFLYTKVEGRRQVYWQGPSIGWDLGGDGNRTMMLVYDLPNSLAIYRRYAGVNGSAYLVGRARHDGARQHRDPRAPGLHRPDQKRRRRATRGSISAT